MKWKIFRVGYRCPCRHNSNKRTFQNFTAWRKLEHENFTVSTHTIYS